MQIRFMQRTTFDYIGLLQHDRPARIDVVSFGSCQLLSSAKCVQK